MPVSITPDFARVARGAALVLLTALAPAVALQAQSAIKKRQTASVEQDIANTHIRISYSRPVARGRVLFGGIVPWKRVWNPGADTATAITLSTPIRINGETLAAGSYSVWAEPDSTSWTIIFSSATPVFHTPYPRGRDVLRVQATPRSAPHMETLAFYFPVVEERHAELVLHWGTVVVPLAIDVP